MQTVKFVHWQESDAWIGYLLDYPDYWTQGDTLEDPFSSAARYSSIAFGPLIPGVFGSK